MQTSLVGLPASSARKKVTVLPIDYGSAAQQERLKLENKYREVIEEKLDWRQLVTYVPNKKLPLYNWFKFKEGFSRDLVVKLFKEFAVQAACERLGFTPGEIFAHPEVLQKKPELFEYYRLLGCLPNKGLGQIKQQLGLSKKSIKTSEELQLKPCRLLNRFISNAISRTATANRESLIRTIYAEAGSEWQGTWVNNIGQLAVQELQQVVVEFAEQKNLVDRHKTELAAEEGNYLVLKSGMKICFGSELDVECRSKTGELVCVIEIKGSADKAGAQTRLGETKKSFTKAKLENPRCHTIFLPSVLTPAVQKQFTTERDIDQVFNLLAILRDESKRIEFLEELFKFRLREKI